MHPSLATFCFVCFLLFFGEDGSVPSSWSTLQSLGKKSLITHILTIF